MNQTGEINLEYQLSAHELFEFGKYSANLPFVRRTWSIAGAVFGSVLAFLSYSNAQNLLLSILGGVLSGLAFRFFMIKATPKITIKNKQNKILINETSSVNIDSRGITIGLAGNRHFHAWGNIHYISETESLLLIFTDEKSAVIIPKRALVNQEQLKTTISLLEQYQAKAV